MANILWPSSAKTRARGPATVVLPDPPLPTIAIFIVGAFDALSPPDRSISWSDDAHRNSHGCGIVQPLMGNEPRPICRSAFDLPCRRAGRRDGCSNCKRRCGAIGNSLRSPLHQHISRHRTHLVYIPKREGKTRKG